MEKTDSYAAYQLAALALLVSSAGALGTAPYPQRGPFYSGVEHPVSDFHLGLSLKDSLS